LECIVKQRDGFKNLLRIKENIGKQRRQPMQNESPKIYERPVEILQNLIRFDTTNPPGNEGKCIAYIYDLLKAAGFQPNVLAKQANRPNLLTRLKGRGEAPPLLLYAHVDVVTTANQKWTYPPFEARIVDGQVWGRGAIDMKSGVAMMLAAFIRAKEEKLEPAGDILFLVLSDEEALGVYGAKFLVEEHPEQFEGVRYALGEFGGATVYLAGHKCYPIQVSEKQTCWMKATIEGVAGHASKPARGEAMAKLGEMLRQLDRSRLPVHITPAASLMIQGLTSTLPFPQNLLLSQVLNPVLTDRLLSLLGAVGENLEPLFHNTVNATIVHGGEKINVIPSEIEVQLDGRLLPGFTPEDMFAELRTVIGDEIELEVLNHDPMDAEPDMGYFDALGKILREADPGGVPIPLLLPAVTDARFFTRLGIQTYGFTPMKLPKDFDFFGLAHAEDERIPVEAVEFGTRAMFEAIRRYGK
jgi:acetylornithine deacetylase/succinyl-diaminopimelate desuccinylase-like protein